MISQEYSPAVQQREKAHASVFLTAHDIITSHALVDSAKMAWDGASEASSHPDIGLPMIRIPHLVKRSLQRQLSNQLSD